jgi:DNA-binding response OmpR family regulator
LNIDMLRGERPMSLSPFLRSARDQAAPVRPGALAGQIRVLVVSAEPRRTAPWCQAIQKRFAVTVAHDAAPGYSVTLRSFPHVVVIDAGDPALDALALCRRLRADHSAVPILLVDQCGTTESLLAAFDAGADAYLRGPIDGSEILALIGALARRYVAGGPRRDPRPSNAPAVHGA